VVPAEDNTPSGSRKRRQAERRKEREAEDELEDD
jgi:hypothetical protein